MELIDSLSLGELPVELWYRRSNKEAYTWVIEINTDDACFLVSDLPCPRYRIGDDIVLHGTVGIRIKKYGLHPLVDVLAELNTLSGCSLRQRCDRSFAGVEYNIINLREYLWHLDAIREILEKITVIP
jgi:hypothetical protein